MGVFARLLGRSKATQEEAAAAAPQTDTESAAAEAAEAAPAAEATGTTEEGREGAAAEPEAAGAATAEGAEIPKQQSADEVADSEAGEGART